VCGWPPAPAVGAVHDVVVDQRADVQQLERGRGRDDLRTVRGTGRAVAPVAERGAQQLAADGEVGQHPHRARELGTQFRDRLGPFGEIARQAGLDPLAELRRVRLGDGHGGRTPEARSRLCRQWCRSRP
jgi:hypothetical protein